MRRHRKADTGDAVSALEMAALPEPFTAEWINQLPPEKRKEVLAGDFGKRRCSLGLEAILQILCGPDKPRLALSSTTVRGMQSYFQIFLYR
jgi:hypothetical protein